MGSDEPVIGNVADAAEAAGGWEYANNTLRLNLIGQGEARECWLIGGVVYKVARWGRESANAYEHQVLSAWRAAGAEWAPATTLWTVRCPIRGELIPVVAMPYLPDDGPLDRDAVAQIREQAASELWEGNCQQHNGRVWLVDGGDVDRLPTD
ncbi:MAG TPA: hypothetical protein VIS06_04100 [Mycobacteriales bacterium]